LAICNCSLWLNDDPANGGGWSSTIEIKPTPTGLYDIMVEWKGAGDARDLKWSGNGADDLKEDVEEYNGNVRPRDVFRFDGHKFARSDVFR